MCEFCPIFSEYFDECLTATENSNLEELKRALDNLDVHFYYELEDENYNELVTRALTYNNYGAVELLLASYYQKNFCKRDLNFFDNFEENYKQIKDLHEYTASKLQFLHQAMECGETPIVSFLITHEKITTSNAIASNYLKPELHYAVCYQDKATLEQVLKNNKEMLLVQDDRGWTALHYAVARRDYEIIEFMLTAHAGPVVIADAQGHTPLLVLVRNIEFTEVSVSLLKLLLTYGAEVMHKNMRGETALELVLNAIHNSFLWDKQSQKYKIAYVLLETLLMFGALSEQLLSTDKTPRAFVDNWYVSPDNDEQRKFIDDITKLLSSFS